MPEKTPKTSKCRYFMKNSAMGPKTDRNLVFCAASTFLNPKSGNPVLELFAPKIKFDCNFEGDGEENDLI